jgi:hypothetical protein
MSKYFEGNGLLSDAGKDLLSHFEEEIGYTLDNQELNDISIQELQVLGAAMTKMLNDQISGKIQLLKNGAQPEGLSKKEVISVPAGATMKDIQSSLLDFQSKLENGTFDADLFKKGLDSLLHSAGEKAKEILYPTPKNPRKIGK